MELSEKLKVKPLTVLAVGIDAGVNTGIAVWDKPTQKFNDIFTTDFWGAITYLDSAIYPFEVVIEDPRGNKPVFMKRGVKGRGYLKIAQNVGSVKRDTQLIYEWCINHKISVTCVVPGKSKWRKGKITSAEFKRITGYEKSTSQHGRDGGMLVFGK